MSGLSKSIQKYDPHQRLQKKIVGQKNFDKIHFIDTSIRDYNDSMKPPTAPTEAVIPMPDEDEIKRSKRRGVASRGGGRADTQLSGDGDRLGP